MSSSWYEDDRLWEALRPVLFPAQRLDAAEREVERVVGLLGLEPPARLLDLCCGVGRHAVLLARRGFRVTAVDRTTLYLDEARHRAREAGVEIELVEADMRDFRREASFDGAVNLFSSFGYFEDEGEDRTVAENLAASLRPGGALVLDTTAKEVVARDFRERGWTEADGVLLLEERSVTRDWSWIVNRWIVIPPDGQKIELDLSLRVYSAVELSSLLREAGFAHTRALGSLEGAPYDHRAERLVMTARR